MASQTRSVDNTVSSEWTNPDYAFTENDQCTTATTDGDQNVYNIINTPFTIPTGVTIEGIEVKVIRATDVDDYYEIELQDKVPAWKLKTGTSYLATCADGALETLGGAADLWGGSWDAAHINSSSFQIRLTYQKTGKANTPSVDHIEVTVYYTSLTKEFTADVLLQKTEKKEFTADVVVAEIWYCTLNGTIVATEENCDERGFDWDYDSGEPYAHSLTESGSYGTGAFGLQLTGLIQGNTVYFRAKAHNSGGWGYGDEKSVVFSEGETYTKTFTSDIVLVDRLTKETTADIVLQKTDTKTLTADTILVDRLTKSITADIVLVDREIKTFTADIVLQETDKKEFTADILLQKADKKEFTADIILVDRLTEQITADTVLVDRLTKTITADITLVDREVKTFTADVLVQKTASKDFTADIVLVDRLSKTFTTDILLLKTDSKAVTADITLVDRETKTFTADTVLLLVPTKTFDADIVLVDRESKTFTADIVLVDRLDKTLTADIVLVDRLSKTFTADVLTLKTDTKTFMADTVLLEINAKTFTADIVLKEVTIGTKTFTADTVLLKTQAKSITADIVLVDRLSEEVTADIILVDRLAKTLTADITIVDRLAKTFTADVVTSGVETKTKTFTADIIVGEVEKPRGVRLIVREAKISYMIRGDLIIKGETTANIMANTLFKVEEESSITGNVYWLKSLQANILSNLLIRREILKELYSDTTAAYVTLVYKVRANTSISHSMEFLVKVILDIKKIWDIIFDEEE